jgi:predicted phosphohydrolase
MDSFNSNEGVIIVCLSDTHELHTTIEQPLPPGDVLIHCGDFTNSGDEAKVRGFLSWMESQPFSLKLLIAGNHDYSLHEDCAVRCDQLLENYRSINYLRDSKKEIEATQDYSENRSMSAYGTPWVPEFPGCAVEYFYLPRDDDQLAAKWREIPTGVDILMTHTPPRGVRDMFEGSPMGCDALRLEVFNRVKPRVHVFGHIHAEHGAHFDESIGCLFVNAATLNGENIPTNRPIRVFVPFDRSKRAVVI